MARQAVAEDTRRGDGRRPQEYARLTSDLVARWFARPDLLPRLVVAFCVAVTVAAVVVLYPEAFADANRLARANAALDYLDREIGGGNSVLPDQGVAVQARGLIPVGDTFAVDVGEPQEGWSELATPDAIATYMRFFLLPRRERSDAPWIVCFACDRAAHPDAQPVWEDEEGLSILRRNE